MQKTFPGIQKRKRKRESDRERERERGRGILWKSEQLICCSGRGRSHREGDLGRESRSAHCVSDRQTVRTFVGPLRAYACVNRGFTECVCVQIPSVSLTQTALSCVSQEECKVNWRIRGVCCVCVCVWHWSGILSGYVIKSGSSCNAYG